MKEIKVGAIIEGFDGTRGIVTRFDSENGWCNMLWEDGDTSVEDERCISPILTDEIYDIENVFAAIKGKDAKSEIKIEMIIKNE